MLYSDSNPQAQLWVKITHRDRTHCKGVCQGHKLASKHSFIAKHQAAPNFSSPDINLTNCRDVAGKHGDAFQDSILHQASMDEHVHHLQDRCCMHPASTLSINNSKYQSCFPQFSHKQVAIEFQHCSSLQGMPPTPLLLPSPTQNAGYQRLKLVQGMRCELMPLPQHAPNLLTGWPDTLDRHCLARK